MDPVLHHIGCLVADIEISLKSYRVLLPAAEMSQVYNIPEQGVKVQFLKLNDNTWLEFVEPLGDENPLKRLLKKGSNFYHIGLLTASFDKEIERLELEGYRKINEFKSPAFNNNRCSFLFNPEMHLIELIEK